MDNHENEIEIAWYNSLQFRVLAIFLGMFILILLSILAIARTIGEDLIRDQAYQKVSRAGKDVVTELEKRTATASALVNSMARLVTAQYQENAINRDAIPPLLGIYDPKSLIAGGGIWPEPYVFESTEVRASFFGEETRRVPCNSLTTTICPRETATTERNGMFPPNIWVPVMSIGQNPIPIPTPSNPW